MTNLTINNTDYTALYTTLNSSDKRTLTNIAKKLNNGITTFTVLQQLLISTHNIDVTTVNINKKLTSKTIYTLVDTNDIDTVIESIASITDNLTEDEQHNVELYTEWLIVNSKDKESYTNLKDNAIGVDFSLSAKRDEYAKFVLSNAIKEFNITFKDVFNIFRDTISYQVLNGKHNMSAYKFSNYKSLVAIQVASMCGLVVYTTTTTTDGKTVPTISVVESIINNISDDNMKSLHKSLFISKHGISLNPKTYTEKTFNRMYKNGKMSLKKELINNHLTTDNTIVMRNTINKFNSTGLKLHDSLYTEDNFSFACKTIASQFLYKDDNNDVIPFDRLTTEQKIQHVKTQESIASLLLSLKGKTFYSNYTTDGNRLYDATKVVGLASGNKFIREFIVLADDYKLNANGVKAMEEYLVVNKSDLDTKTITVSGESITFKGRANRLNNVQDYNEYSNELVGNDGTNQGSQLLAALTKDARLMKYAGGINYSKLDDKMLQFLNVDKDSKFVTMYQTFAEEFGRQLVAYDEFKSLAKYSSDIFTTAAFKYKVVPIMYSQSTKVAVGQVEPIVDGKVENADIASMIQYWFTTIGDEVVTDTMIDIMVNVFESVVDSLSTVIYAWRNILKTAYKSNADYFTYTTFTGSTGLIERPLAVTDTINYPAYSGVKSMTITTLINSKESSVTTKVSPSMLQNLDSSILQVMANRSDAVILCSIHDELFSTLNDVYTLREQYKETIVDIFNSDLATNIASEIGCITNGQDLSSIGDCLLTEQMLLDSTDMLTF